MREKVELWCESTFASVIVCDGEVRAVLSGGSPQSILMTFTEWKKTAHCVVYICLWVESLSAQVWSGRRWFFLKKRCFFFCLSHQNFGGGMRPPHNTMGPGMPGVNMWAFLNGRIYQSWALRLINKFSNNNLNGLVGTQGSGNWSAMAQSQ